MKPHVYLYDTLRNSMSRWSKGLFKKIILGFIPLLVFTHAQAVDNTIIVFDASGSMWGKVEGKTKISAAKQTLENLITKWDESKPLGLIAYGHRAEGDCSDIQVLVPLGKVNKPEMVATIKAITPRGKTPISAALRMAADELGFRNEGATIILISDGKETCNVDPCKTATDLEKLGIDLTAHVIGFDVDPPTSSQLSCIASSTGGRYFSADSADQLNKALEEVSTQLTAIPSSATDAPEILDQTQFRVNAESTKTIELDSVKSSTSRTSEYLLDAILTHTGDELSLNLKPTIVDYYIDLPKSVGNPIPSNWNRTYDLTGRRIGGISHSGTPMFTLSTLGVFSINKLMLEIPEGEPSIQEHWQVATLSSAGPLLLNVNLVKLSETEIEITFQSIDDNIELSKQSVEVVGQGTYNRKTLLVNKANWTEVVWLTTKVKQNGVEISLKSTQRTHIKIQRNN